MFGNPVGIIRNIDSLGRIVIPKEFRKYLGIKTNDKICIYVDDEDIFIYKDYQGVRFEIQDMRRIDELGRIIIPFDIRKTLNISCGDIKKNTIGNEIEIFCFQKGLLIRRKNNEI